MSQCLKLVYVYAEGKEALNISNAWFNKTASAAYNQLSSSEKVQLSNEQEDASDLFMNKQQIHRRVQRIFKSIQNQVSHNALHLLAL